MYSMFAGRKLAIATMHGKEKAIAPPLEKALGVTCITAALDTDTLGTFTGEIERTLDPVAAAREKCMQAMELTGCDMAVASEGSFGPHPFLFFVPADEEYLVFIDRKNGLEISVKELSTATNFAGQETRTEAELLAFAERVQFPSHGLILRPDKGAATGIVKGITQKEQLLAAFRQLMAAQGKVYAETDMRAMYNPSRMAVIETAAVKLAEKINSACPRCNTPGFGITDAKPGLPCSWCGAPTRSTLSFIYRCSHCNFVQEAMYPHGKQAEDPMYCDFCNP